MNKVATLTETVNCNLYGDHHPEDKIFNNGGQPLVVPTTKHYPPDTTAAIFWLKNRQKENWRDSKKVSVDTRIQNLTDEELEAEIDALSD